jgi:dUTP pyrophosphatase
MIGMFQKVFMIERIRGFEIVSKYENEKDIIIMPKRGTRKSACYDIFNNTGEDIFLLPGEISHPLTTKLKSYMLDDEVLMAFVRSSIGFGYSVRLANSTGIIDCDYYNNAKNEGEIFVKLHNQGFQLLTIEKGKAFAQVMFQKYLLADGDSFTIGNIRDGGIGSTNSL